MSKINFFRILLLCLLFISFHPNTVLSQEASRYALLVGVTNYPAEVLGNDQKQLKGPKNDVVLLWNTLVREGVPHENIMMLADSLSDVTNYSVDTAIVARRPTRENIINGLEWLMSVTKPGDQVFIYLSGHGTYVPEREKVGGKTEIDGKDEVFLPIDIGLWDQDGREIPNQLIDDVFAEKIEPLVRKKVFVWFVVDACHSGTAVRSSSEEQLVTRNLDPQRDLRIPDDASSIMKNQIPQAGVQAVAEQRPFDFRDLDASSFVAFYASQPSERAVEGPVPKGGTDPNRPVHGLLTWSLAQALRGGHSRNYETIARFIRANYWQWGSGAPLPLFEGNLDASPMVGGEGTKTLGLEYRNQRLHLKAGQIDDIGVGTVVGIFIPNETPSNHPIAYGRVVEAGIEEAILTLIDGESNYPNRIKEQMTRDYYNPNTDLQIWLQKRTSSLGARLIYKTASFVLSVGSPIAFGHVDVAAAKDIITVDRILDEVNVLGSTEQILAFERAVRGQLPDVNLFVEGGRLWFTPPGGDVITSGPQQAYSLSIDQLDANKLMKTLRVIAKSRNIARIADSFSDTELARRMQVRFAVLKRQPSQATGRCVPHTGVEPSRVPDEARFSDLEGMSKLDPTHIDNCDIVYIEVTNNGENIIEVTPLYIDPWSSIYFVPGYRDAIYSAMQIAPGEKRIISYTENTVSQGGSLIPVGLGRVILIAVNVGEQNSNHGDFRYLSEQLLPVRKPITSSLQDLLDAAGFGNGEQRTAPVGDYRHAAILSLPFKTSAE